MDSAPFRPDPGKHARDPLPADGPASPPERADDPDALRRIVLYVVACVAAALALVGAVGWAALEVEDSVRSYVRGESLWSKAQKEAVIALHAYARSGDEIDWRRYREAIRVPLADRRAREALQSDPLDAERAREGFRGGGLEPDEIPGMIRLYRWFGDRGLMQEAVRIWASADTLIGELRAQADRIRSERRSADPDTAVISDAIRRVDALNDDLARLERQFSLTIDSLADRVRRWSQRALGALVALLLLGAGGLTFWLYRHLRGREEVLHRTREQLRHQALHDPLTGLPNRALLADRIEQGVARSRRSGTPLGLIMLDIDRFKRVNDRLGHAAGDRVLSEVARRLEEAVRREDTVARWGGDEFVIVLPELERVEGLARVRERIREQVRPPIDTAREPVHVDVTLGAVVRGAGDHRRAVQTDDPDELVRFGSLALHRAKEDAPAGFRVFDPDEEREGAAEVRRERELRDALGRGDIVPHYQPVVRIEDGSVVRVEALARWRHPDRGLLSPADFVPLAEDLGLIGAVDDAVRRRGCRTVAEWKDHLDGGRTLELAVNVSGRRFGDPELAETLEREVRRAGLRPGQVILELTETTLMRKPAGVEAVRRRGFRVYVDDFGTGYSSLGYLRDLELDGLKIDLSFVQGIVDSAPDAAIVETLLTLGDRLDLEVVAEGVESQAQRERLRGLGCELGQGFLFARPASAEETAARWREGRAAAGG